MLSCTGIPREEQRPDETGYRGRSQDKSHRPRQGSDWSTSVRAALLAYGPSEAEGSVFIQVHMYSMCVHTGRFRCALEVFIMVAWYSLVYLVVFPLPPPPTIMGCTVVFVCLFTSLFTY